MGCPRQRSFGLRPVAIKHFASGKKCEGGGLQIQKKPQRNTYRGFFPMSTGLGQRVTQATETLPPRRTHTKWPVVPNHSLDVRYWHIADIDADDEHVRFRGQSGHP